MYEKDKIFGERLKIIREIMNSGSKLSSSQFAFLLDESPQKIRNYEMGRTIIPIHLLSKLYEIGINPSYIVTGLGDFFANNPKGKILRQNLLENFDRIDSKIIHRIEPSTKTGTVEK